MRVKNSDITYVLTALFTFIFPINARLSTFLIGLLFLNSIFNIKKIRKRKWRKSDFLFFIPILMYLFYGLGFLYSEKVEFRPFMETKFSLFVWPFIYFVTPIKDSSKIKKILLFFATGTFLSFLYTLLSAGYDWFYLGQNNFFYEKLTHYIHGHPTYLSIYAGISIFILHETKDIFRSKIAKVVFIGMIIFMIIYIILLSARMSLIVNVFLALFFLIRAQREKIKFKKIIWPLILLGLPIVYGLSRSHQFKSRFADLVVKTEYGYKPNNVRLRIWDAGIQVIKKNVIWGQGSGDANTEIYKYYDELGYTKSLHHKYNYHNQYLQIWASIGIFALLLLFVFYFFPLQYLNETFGTLLGFIMLSFAIGGVTESFLEREAAIVPLLFFYSLIIMHIIPFKQMDK